MVRRAAMSFAERRRLKGERTTEPNDRCGRVVAWTLVGLVGPVWEERVPERGAGPEPEHPPQIVAIRGAVARADIPALCARLQALLRYTPGEAPLICDVGELGRADAVVVEALARLQLTARRRGRQIWLRRASPDLLALLVLTGLDEILPVEARGQVEQGKQPRGIEEEGDAGDSLPG